MGLETATYINQLNINNPDDTTDFISGGDDHLRLIKRTIQNSFPRITGPVSATQDDLSKVDYLVDTGTANNILVAPTTAWASYVAGKGFFVKVLNTNTGNVTAKVGSLAAITVLDNGGNALNAGTLVAGSVYQFVYDGTNFRVNANNSITRNSQIALNPLSTVHASIVNTRAGTLVLGTNGLSNITLNADGTTSFYNNTLNATTSTITNLTVTTSLVSPTLLLNSGPLTIQNALPTLNFKDTNARSAILHVANGHYYVLRTDGTNSTTLQMPATGYWGIDHDIDLGKTVFGNEVTVKGDIKIHSLGAGENQKGRVYLGDTNTKYLEYNTISYALPGAELEVNGKQVLKKPHISYSEAYYVPKFVGYFHGLSLLPTWLGNLITTTPTGTKNSTGNFSFSFPGISTIHSIQLLGADATGKALISITAVTGNSVTFTVHNTGGTLVNPDICVYVQVYGA